MPGKYMPGLMTTSRPFAITGTTFEVSRKHRKLTVKRRWLFPRIKMSGVSVCFLPPLSAVYSTFYYSAFTANWSCKYSRFTALLFTVTENYAFFNRFCFFRTSVDEYASCGCVDCHFLARLLPYMCKHGTTVTGRWRAIAQLGWHSREHKHWFICCRIMSPAIIELYKK